ncbi:hypothetical protein HDU92_005787 [Lobulomyces angularis]|nr:hypothetical protein HDU92_005787 [Lobulomyces angularis]
MISPANHSEPATSAVPSIFPVLSVTDAANIDENLLKDPIIATTKRQKLNQTNLSSPFKFTINSLTDFKLDLTKIANETKNESVIQHSNKIIEKVESFYLDGEEEKFKLKEKNAVLESELNSLKKELKVKDLKVDSLSNIILKLVEKNLEEKDEKLKLFKILQVVKELAV